MSILIEHIRHSIIGTQQCFNGPFGEKPLIYADYTASGRSLHFIEDTIQEHVLPWYANTHSESSLTGAHTTALREQARQTILKAVNSGVDDRLLFCESGATGAINKLIDILNISLPFDLNRQYKLLDQIPAQQRPVIFIGPYEHHSNELPWRESIADVVCIAQNQQGQIDLDVLEKSLLLYQERPLKIGSFSAASNVTGIKSDVKAVTTLLKKYDALACWDYAAAAPYTAIDMKNIDAVFISTHKFIGGPGTPGILILKQQLIQNSVPSTVGGGTVSFVSPNAHTYITDQQRREEGGTPAIVESIRAGLVFKLQQEVGIKEIDRRESSFIKRAISRLQQLATLEILGNTEVERMSIMSLRFRHQGLDLHYSYIVALFNDLFGIQLRGGCSCAGPYGHALLNIDEKKSDAIARQLQAGVMILRPGWVRLNFNYFIDEAEFQYLVRAIELIAEHAWRLLPFYQFDAKSSTWRYQGQTPTINSELFDVAFEEQRLMLPSRPLTNPNNLDDYLLLAEKELKRERRDAQRYELHLPQNCQSIRWFVLPQDVVI